MQSLTRLVLTNFRSFTQHTFDFDSALTLIIGDNGHGKTNTLEAISLLSTGRSFRAKLLSDCVRSGEEVAHVDALIVDDGDEIQFGASILAAQNAVSKRASTRFRRNGAAKRKSDVVGLLKTVLFRPEDLDIITEGPSYKRDFLDDVLVQVGPAYLRSLRDYEKALKNRNKLILQLREGLATRSDFLFWDTLLVKHGDVLTRERARFVEFINTAVIFPIRGEVVYDKSLMSEERLRQYAIEEVAAGKTLVGPHRDSLVLNMDLRSTSLQHSHLGKGEGAFLDVARFGSRGQQRMSVLWLKIAAMLFIEKETQVRPLLLLDDIFSELDEHNRHIVIDLFHERQVIITSAEPVDFAVSGSTITL